MVCLVKSIWTFFWGLTLLVVPIQVSRGTASASQTGQKAGINMNSQGCYLYYSFIAGDKVAININSWLVGAFFFNRGDGGVTQWVWGRHSGGGVMTLRIWHRCFRILVSALLYILLDPLRVSVVHKKFVCGWVSGWSTIWIKDYI